MEEIENKLPKEYLDGFNNGYLFSKNFPEVAQSINDQTKYTDELSPVNGMLGGIEQGLKDGRELVNDRLNQLEDIENKSKKDRDFNIER
jgi:hypothetical protein